VSWTPQELIESLGKWQPDEPIDVSVQHLGIGDIRVMLVQGTNAIHLTDGDSA
jgi:hypothetical protein